MTRWKLWADMIGDDEWPPTRNASDEAEFNRTIARYERVVRGRIAWLSDRLPTMDRSERAEAHYVLATLHDRLAFEEPPAVFKRAVRWHCIRAARLDPSNHRALALLGFTCSWIACLGASKGSLRRPIRVQVHCGPAPPREWSEAAPTASQQSGFSRRWAARALRYVKRALTLDPGNATYLRWQCNFQCGHGPG